MLLRVSFLNFLLRRKVSVDLATIPLICFLNFILATFSRFFPDFSIIVVLFLARLVNLSFLFHGYFSRLLIAQSILSSILINSLPTFIFTCRLTKLCFVCSQNIYCYQLSCLMTQITYVFSFRSTASGMFNSSENGIGELR